MQAVKFPQANVALTAPKGMEQEVYTLHAHRDGKHHISKWTLTWRERLQVLRTGTIWLWVMSPHSQPPVSVDVRDPWGGATPKNRWRNNFIRRWFMRRRVRKAIREAVRESLS